MAPHLRLEDWSRLYQPDSPHRPSRLSYRLFEDGRWLGWRDPGNDPVAALRQLVQFHDQDPDRTPWELAWEEVRYSNDRVVIASSESVDYWRSLLHLADELPA